MPTKKRNVTWICIISIIMNISMCITQDGGDYMNEVTTLNLSINTLVGTDEYYLQ